MLGRKIMELILNAQLLKCKKLCNDAKLPSKNDGDIGWDICCIKNELLFLIIITSFTAEET